MRALIFDLDGTLIDSAPEIAGVLNSVMTDAGAPPFDLATVKSYIGEGIGVTMRRAMRARGLDDADHARLTAEMSRRYVDAHGMTEFYSGVREALDGWLEAGVPMALCTNKPIAATTAVLEHMDLARYFVDVVGGDSLPTRKPDPAMLYHSMQAMGTRNVLYIGDSEVDAGTAKAASVPFALFTEGYRKTPVAQIHHDLAFSDWTVFADGLHVDNP